MAAVRDEALLRYSRQIMLPELDVAGQRRLMDAEVLVVGMGGLGCPAAMYLLGAGTGHLIIADDDKVELPNLQRQIAYSQAVLGRPKVAAARAVLQGMNPNAAVTALGERMEGEALDEAVMKADLVVDACDNFATRFAVNRSCLKHRRPLVSGAAIRMEGQVAVFDPRRPDSPCYQCLYQPGGEEDTRCSANGVMAPLVGIVGSVQAMEAVKLIAGLGEPLTGRLLLLDAAAMQWREMRLPRDPDCAACGGRESG